MDKIKQISENIALSDWEKMLQKGKYFIELSKELKEKGESLKSHFRENETVGNLRYTQATKLRKVALNESRMRQLYDEGNNDLNLLIKEFSEKFQTGKKGGPIPSNKKSIVVVAELNRMNKIKVDEDLSNKEILGLRITQAKEMIELLKLEIIEMTKLQET